MVFSYHCHFGAKRRTYALCCADKIQVQRFFASLRMTRLVIAHPLKVPVPYGPIHPAPRLPHLPYCWRRGVKLFLISESQWHKAGIILHLPRCAGKPHVPNFCGTGLLRCFVGFPWADLSVGGFGAYSASASFWQRTGAYQPPAPR